MPVAFVTWCCVSADAEAEAVKKVFGAKRESSKTPKNGEATHKGQQFNQATDEVRREIRLIG